MNDNNRSIPQPVAFDQAPPPEIPSHLKPPPPGPLRLTTLNGTGIEELAVVYKRTYTLEHDRLLQLSDNQKPLDEEGTLHDELSPGVTPSCKSLPEVIAYKGGTDVVVQASACAPKPVTNMNVAVQVGNYSHAAQVYGRRYCDYVYGELIFTPPEPFEEIPLRHENAYGGRDVLFEKEFIDELKNSTSAEDMRRIKVVGESLFKDCPPLVYPRNRFGKGYILGNRREHIEGRELPNLERPDDRLTPERIVIDNLLNWNRQPLPVLFDYLDAGTFPRSAMLAMPPLMAQNQEPVLEVVNGLIPEDYCRGNIFAAQPSDMPDLIHPLAGRCAPLEMWLPFLQGDEVIVLYGMHKSIWEYRVQLPKEKPIFRIDGLHPKSTDMNSELLLICVNMQEKTVDMIWAGRTPLSRELMPGETNELVGEVHVDIRRW